MTAASDLLRRAAKVLREHAEAAPHGPWSWMGGYPQQVTNGAATLIADIFENPDMRSTIAEYVALMDPAVGLALADWIDSIAETHEGDPDDYCAGRGHEPPWPFTDGSLEDCGAWWCANVDRALAVARAVLRQDEPHD